MVLPARSDESALRVHRHPGIDPVDAPDAQRAGVAVAGVGALAAIVALLVRGYKPSGSKSDGPDSSEPKATGLCRQALAIIRNDEYEKFGEAYSKLREAIDLRVEGRVAGGISCARCGVLQS